MSIIFDNDDPREYASDTAMVSKASVHGSALGGVRPYEEQEWQSPAPSSVFGQLLGMLKYKWTIVLVCLVLAIPSVFAIWSLIAPQYTTKASIRVKPIIPRLVFKTDENGAIPFYSSYVNTQVALLSSPTVINRVLDREDVRSTQWYKNPPKSLIGGTITPPYERMQEVMAAHSRGNRSEIIDIKVTLGNPREATTIANAILQEYIKYTNEIASREGDKVYRELREREKKLREEIEGRRQTIAQLAEELGTQSPEELISQRRVRLDAMTAELEDTRRQLAIAKASVEELTAFLDKQGEEDTDVVADVQPQYVYQNDPGWRNARAAVREAELEIELAKTSLGPGHPDLLKLQRQLEHAQRTLQEREKELANYPVHGYGVEGVNVTGDLAGSPSSPATQLAVLKRTVKSLEVQEQLLAKDVEKYDAEFKNAFGLAQMLTRETALIKYRTDIYEQVRKSLDVKEIEEDTPASIEVLAEAQPPSSPSKDRRVLFTAMALCVSLGAGCGIAFIRANMSSIRGVVHRSNDLIVVREAPVLGILPLAVGKDANRHEMVQSQIHQEFVRVIRTCLMERLPRSTGNAVLVTSPEQGTGKTTLTMLLARSLAKCNHRVLLVEGDLRDPSLSSYYDRNVIPHNEVLVYQDDDLEPYQDTEHPNVHIYFSERVVNPSDADLFANGVFKRKLNKWRSKYDIILIDSPPVIPVADACILARHVDGTLMIVREGRTRRDDIQRSMEMLQSSGGRMLGTVYVGSVNPREYYYSYGSS